MTLSERSGVTAAAVRAELAELEKQHAAQKENVLEGIKVKRAQERKRMLKTFAKAGVEERQQSMAAINEPYHKQRNKLRKVLAALEGEDGTE